LLILRYVINSCGRECVPEMGTEMNADPSLMKEPSPLDERERIISICNELLCSGRPFAEVLKEIKRLSDKPTRDTVELGSSGPMIGLANDCPAPAKELPVLRERALEPQPDPGSSVFQFFGPQRALRLRRTLFVIGFLVLSVSIIAGYVQLGAVARQPAPNRQNEIQLLQQLHDRGQFISKSLRPAIDNAGLRDAPTLNAAVKLRTGGAKAIRVLFAPGGGESFYYAASWPARGDDLEAERRQMTRLGILDRLAASCHNGTPFELLGSEPTFGNEGVAVNPLWTPAGCWVVVSVFAVDLSGPPNAPASSRQPGIQLVRSEAFPQP
jgi:hypothetical protein